MSNKTNVIIIEDSSDDALLIERELRRAGLEPCCHRVETAQELRQALCRPGCDLVIADYNMPHFDGMSALRIVKEKHEIPFILISGKISVETAVEVLKAGAHNYIMKDRISLLGPAALQAIDDARCQRQARQLEQANRVLARVVEQSPISIMITSTGGIISHVNPKLCSLTGYTPDELIGKNPNIFQSGETDPELYRQLWKTLLAGGVWSGTFRNKKKDGSLFWEQAIIAPVHDDQGRMIQFVAIKEDISELLLRQQELEQARDQAEAANRAKTEFLANMSHELRTPLNGIIGMSQLLRLSPLTFEQQEYMDGLDLSSANLLSLISDILDMTQIEADRLAIEEEPFSLPQSIAALLKTQQKGLNSKGLRCTVQLPDDLPEVMRGDALRVKQILLNLLSNAIKYTPKGSITISAVILERDETHLVLQFGVQDTGIGMSQETLAKIFTPFVQADMSTTRVYGGPGLGLAICKRLADLMGGSIRVESAEGKGSTFYVTLPFLIDSDNQDLQATLSPHYNGAYSGKPLRILLAEDNPINYKVALTMLCKMGHSVTSARDGKAALDAWQQGEFDLILMDIRMPVMDGIASTSAIRERESTTGKHIPIIAVTVHGLAGERERFSAMGFDGYLLKPFRIKELVAEMQHCLLAHTTHGS